MRKHELRQKCLERNIPARLRENDDIESKVDSNNSEKICESCEENPSKLYKSPAAKWFVRIVSNIFETCVKMLMRS